MLLKTRLQSSDQPLVRLGGWFRFGDWFKSDGFAKRPNGLSALGRAIGCGLDPRDAERDDANHQDTIGRYGMRAALCTERYWEERATGPRRQADAIFLQNFHKKELQIKTSCDRVSGDTNFLGAYAHVN